jgi:hypothetical protein
MNQLIAKVSSVPSVRQLIALRMDRGCGFLAAKQDHARRLRIVRIRITLSQGSASLRSANLIGIRLDSQGLSVS